MTRWCRGISLSMPENQSGWGLASSTRLTGEHSVAPATWHLTPGTWHWHWHLALALAFSTRLTGEHCFSLALDTGTGTDTWHSKLTRQFFFFFKKSSGFLTHNSVITDTDTLISLSIVANQSNISHFKEILAMRHEELRTPWREVQIYGFWRKSGGGGKS